MGTLLCRCFLLFLFSLVFLLGIVLSLIFLSHTGTFWSLASKHHANRVPDRRTETTRMPLPCHAVPGIRSHHVS